MGPIEPDQTERLLAEFFRDILLPRRDSLARNGAAAGFLPVATGSASYFLPPVVDWQRRPDFEVPEMTTPEQLVGALADLWQKSGVTPDPIVLRQLADLAFRMRSDDDFDSEPPPFVYTL